MGKLSTFTLPRLTFGFFYGNSKKPLSEEDQSTEIKVLSQTSFKIGNATSSFLKQASELLMEQLFSSKGMRRRLARNKPAISAFNPLMGNHLHGLNYAHLRRETKQTLKPSTVNVMHSRLQSGLNDPFFAKTIAPFTMQKE
jgi:hypothetical protein